MDVFAFVKDGKVTQYPVGIQEIKRANPSVSFPKDVSKLTDVELASLNAARVTDGPVPKHDVKTHYLVKNPPVLEGGSWITKWEAIAKTTEQVEQEELALGSILRKDRNQFLQECDWTVLPDNQLSSDKVTEWKTYRQSLRDVTKQVGFPSKCTWPTKPT